MAKRKWRRGPQIHSLDELCRQKMIFWWNKPTPKGWFASWQFKMTAQALEYGAIYYAMPEGHVTRLSDEKVIRAERRLRTPPTMEGRKELIELLNAHDCGNGDVDDIIDRYEDAPDY